MFLDARLRALPASLLRRLDGPDLHPADRPTGTTCRREHLVPGRRGLRDRASDERAASRLVRSRWRSVVAIHTCGVRCPGRGDSCCRRGSAGAHPRSEADVRSQDRGAVTGGGMSIAAGSRSARVRARLRASPPTTIDDRDHEHHRADDVDLHRYAALRDAPDVHRERRRRARVEVGDDEVVERQRERQQRGAEDAREDQREGDPPERLPTASRRGPSPACSRVSLMPASRARTVTTTNDRQNMMCAIRIVPKPS